MKFYFRIFLCTKIAILVLSFSGIQTVSAETYRVYGVASDDVLYIREGPSNKSKIIDSIPPSGVGIEKLGLCERVWCKVSYRGITGWSSMNFLLSEKLAETLKPIEADHKTTNTDHKTISADHKLVETNHKHLSQDGLIALTTVSQNGNKSEQYKLHGKTYFIEVSGTVNYKTDPKATDNLGIYGVDACYLYSFTPSKIKVPPVAVKLLNNTGSNDVCADVSYNPQHIYRSKPFVSKGSHQFWIDNLAYRAKPNGGILTIKIYETSIHK